MAKATNTATKRGRGKPPVDPNETKSAKFVRLAGQRVSTALSKIALIGGLSGKGYERTPDQVAKIKAALEKQVADTMAKFNATPDAPAKPTFQL